MAAPDVTPYVDLTLTDVDAQTVADRALADAVSKFPEWEPREGNTEVALIEALALEVEEVTFAVNRIPGAVLEVLLRLYGLTRDAGAPASASVTFTLSDQLAHTIPAGTRVLLELGEDTDGVELATTADLVIPAGVTTGAQRTVTATATANTLDGDGTAAGTALEVLDAVPYVDAAVLGSVLTGAREPEDGEAFLERGASRLQRLVTTLVLPEQFTAAALEEAYVGRAFTVDRATTDVLPTPTGVTATPSATGGTLTAATRSYRVSAVNAQGETLASAAVTAVTTGTTASVTVAWAAVVVPPGVGAVTGYRVYGRTGGSELLLTTTAAGATSYVDTGAATPSGALPSANTTAPVAGTVNGHVTVVASTATGVPLAGADKITLENKLEASALAALDVHIADPTITNVDVDVTVTRTGELTAATVQASVLAALDALLTPAAWPFGSTVYRNELIALVDRIPGVDRVVTLTLNGGTADVTLTGLGPLADLAAGSTVTVS